VTDEKKPPPKDADESSVFKALLGKIAKVPKHKVDELERQYQEGREVHRRYRRRKAGG
jgi:hypothetical protein